MKTHGLGKTGSSPFAVRGVVEGFYGTPWKHADRLEMIRFIGERGMNRFMYAPKDDPYLRAEWARPYPAASLSRLSELVAGGNDVGVELIYGLSPGLSIRYSDAGHRGAAKAKLDAVASLGVNHFALLLDDIPARLQHPQDVDAFASLALAQSDFINDIASHLGATPGRTTLAVCPTEYWGYGDEPYITELADRLDADTALLWTGRAICSAALDVADAERFRASTGRYPTYWDNYPVNDVAMGGELHVGPYLGRAATLASHSRGVIANGMELSESSKIAIATIADYLWDPAGYDAEASWTAAIQDVAGTADAPAYRDFADNSRTSCLSAADAPEVTYALEEMTFGIMTGDRERAVAILAPLADRLCASARHLLSRPLGSSRLVDEARPWIEAFEVGAKALRELASLIAAGELEATGPSRLRPYLDDLHRRRVRIFGDVLTMTLDGICHTQTRSTQ